MKIKPIICTGFFLGTMVFSTRGQDAELDQPVKQVETSPLMMLGRGERSGSSDQWSHSRSYPGNDSHLRFNSGEQDSEKNSSAEQLSSSETILDRGYLKLTPEEFQTMVEEPEGFLAWHYSIMNGLKKYNELPDNEEKQKFLFNLDGLAKSSLTWNRSCLRKEQKKPSFDVAESDRYYQRLVACNFLLRGIEVEHARLNGVDLSIQTPREGTIFNQHTIKSYEPNFAAGSMSVVHLLADKRFPGEKFVFKPEDPRKNLTGLVSRQLGFPDTYAREFGVTKKMANLAGRSLATYKLSELLQCSLVPKSGFAVIGQGATAQFGYYQKFIEGLQLYTEKDKPLTQEEMASHPKGKEWWDEILVQMALGESSPEEWRLHFSDSLEQISSEKPLLENGSYIDEERAQELVQQGKLSLIHKVLESVDQEINFKDPHLQRSLANIHLLHLLTGELDPNPLNIIYSKDNGHDWSAYVIDSELSFPGYLNKLDNQVLENLRMRTLALHVRNMPVFIDETMGQAILKLTPDQIEVALEGTGLSTKEVEATKSRLVELQNHIEYIKNTIGLVKFPSSTTINPFTREQVEQEEKALFWGDKTYEESQKEPNSSYLGSILRIREIKKQELQELKQNASAVEVGENLEAQDFLIDVLVNQHSVNRPLDNTESLEVSKGKSRVQNFSFDGSFFNDVPLSNRSSLEGTMETDLTEGTNYTTDTLRTVLATAGMLSRLYFEPYLRPKKNGLFSGVLNYAKSWFSQPISKEMEYLITQTNGHLLDIYQREKSAKKALDNIKKINFDQADLEEQKDLWQKAIIFLKSTEESFKNAVLSYRMEEENGSLLIERQPKLDEIDRKKELCSLSLRWAYLHYAEIQAALCQRNSEGFPISNKHKQRFIETLIRAQQNWRELMGFLESDFESPSLEWKQLWAEKFEHASSLSKLYTRFFNQWLNIAKERYDTLQADFIKNKIEHNNQECELLEELYRDVKGTQDALFASYSNQLESSSLTKTARYLLEEIQLQQLYAAAQKAAIETSSLKEEVRGLANLDFIKTCTFAVENNIHHEFSIVKVEYDQVNKLCEVWGKLKKQRALEIESLMKVALSYAKFVENQNKNEGKKRKTFLTTISNAFLENEPVLNEQEAHLLQEDHGLYEQVRKKLLQAHEEVATWRPKFPSISLEKWEQSTNAEEDKSYYILNTHVEVVPMKRLIEEISETKHSSLMSCLPDLKEMAGLEDITRKATVDPSASGLPSDLQSVRVLEEEEKKGIESRQTSFSE